MIFIFIQIECVCLVCVFFKGVVHCLCSLSVPVYMCVCVRTYVLYRLDEARFDAWLADLDEGVYGKDGLE